MNDRVRVAIAERMNRLPEVEWDRCVLLDDSGVVFGWVARGDGRADFVVLDLSWGDIADLDGKDVPYLAVGFSTSSAILSRTIAERLYANADDHTDCQRIEHVFGDLVLRAVHL